MIRQNFVSLICLLAPKVIISDFSLSIESDSWCLPDDVHDAVETSKHFTATPRRLHKRKDLSTFLNIDNAPFHDQARAEKKS